LRQAAANMPRAISSSSSTTGNGLTDIQQLMDEVAHLRSALDTSDERARVTIDDLRQRLDTTQLYANDINQRLEDKTSECVRLKDDIKQLPSKAEHLSLKKQLQLVQVYHSSSTLLFHYLPVKRISF
jgi:chromosome segregation ATPase